MLVCIYAVCAELYINVLYECIHHPNHYLIPKWSPKLLCYCHRCSPLGLKLYTCPQLKLFTAHSLPHTSIHPDIKNAILSNSSPAMWWYSPHSLLPSNMVTIGLSFVTMVMTLSHHCCRCCLDCAGVPPSNTEHTNDR